MPLNQISRGYATLLRSASIQAIRSPCASDKKLDWNDPKGWPGGYKDADRYCHKYASGGDCASKNNFVKKAGLCSGFYGTWDKPGKLQSLVKSSTFSMWCNNFSIHYPMTGQW